MTFFHSLADHAKTEKNIAKAWHTALIINICL